MAAEWDAFSTSACGLNVGCDGLPGGWGDRLP